MRAKVLIGALLTVHLVVSGGAQQPPAASRATDWPMYRHDLAGTGYSPLTQITVTNVANLTRAWTYRLQSDAPAQAAPTGRGGAGPAGANSQATPIVINGVMYLPTANRVVALDAETGKEIWQYRSDGRCAFTSRGGVLGR